MEREFEQMQAIYQTIVTFMVNYSFQVIGAIIILLIGMLVARKVGHWVLSLCQKRNLDITLSRFIANTVRIIIVMVAITRHWPKQISTSLSRSAMSIFIRQESKFAPAQIDPLFTPVC